jgi:hypothetical protein
VSMVPDQRDQEFPIGSAVVHHQDYLHNKIHDKISTLPRSQHHRDYPTVDRLIFDIFIVYLYHNWYILSIVTAHTMPIASPSLRSSKVVACQTCP